MNDTPTPETNALIATDQHQLEDDPYMPASTYWRMCDLTRKLERERDEAREQRDRLAEALIRIALMDSDNAEPWAIHQHISAIAHNAIHSLKS